MLNIFVEITRTTERSTINTSVLHDIQKTGCQCLSVDAKAGPLKVNMFRKCVF